jgi:hypothetical protein
VDRIEGARVDHDARLRLGLAEDRVGLPAHRHREPEAVGELHDARHVAHAAGSEHRPGRAVHDVAEVVARLGARGRVEDQLAVEPWNAHARVRVRRRREDTTDGVESHRRHRAGQTVENRTSRRFHHCIAHIPRGVSPHPAPRAADRITFPRARA